MGADRVRCFALAAESSAVIEFRLPSLGSDMDEGTLVEWRVKPGDAVKKGQVIAVVDTAKAAIDVECWDEGIVHALLAEPGAKLPVGSPLAVLRGAGENAQDVERHRAVVLAQRAMQPAATARAELVLRQAQDDRHSATIPSTSSGRTEGERAQVSPAARRFAQEQGIDLTTISGRNGVISLDDVQAALRTKAPVSRADAMRRVIAAAMARSKREIPHYYLAEDIAFERASAWLAERNAKLPPAQRLLGAALLAKAVARALVRYPEFNGFWRDDAFAAGSGIHLGIAISLRDGGLVAPALHDVDRQDIATLTRALLDLVKRTRAGALRSSELADATITVTNLGEQGVGSVFGVIYPPQVALVGFGRIGLKPWAFDDGSVRAVPVVTATLSADHRAGDGHRGALLLAEIREQLQSPDTLDAP
jgi:pyruvate dehydrogenase E2 component (dihydrolipoamide acetyltransferase)